MKPPRASGFSLVEMLTLLGIMAIMAALIMPAVNGIRRGGTLTASGNLVLSMANSARQLALGKNTMTALVLLGNQGTAADYRALTVLEFDPVVGWTQATKWEQMPDGCLVDFHDAVNSTFFANSPAPFPFLTRAGQQNPPVLYHGQQVGANAYAARIYLPNGALMNSEKPAQIRVVEGSREVVRQTQYINYTHRAGGSGPANFYDVAIIGLTGTPKVIRP